MGISVNGPSGIDTSSLIEQLVDLEYSNKVDPLEKKKNAYEVSISAYSTMKSLIVDLSAKAAALNDAADFNLLTTGSSDEESATITGTTGCQEGTYSLNVYHLATNEKIASTNNLITSQSAALASMGITTGTFSINGTDITLDDDDTLQDLRMKINNATDTDGDSIGVTASVLKLSSNNYRLVLTAAESGKNGVEYSGATLADLGIISSADGSKDITARELQSATSVRDVFSTLETASVIDISGKDHDGNKISGKIMVTGSMTNDDLFAAIEDIYHGTVDASFNEDGTLILTDNINGPSDLELTFDSFGTGALPAMECTAAGSCGKNILSCGTDACLRIDGMNIESSSNDVEDVIEGGTVHLKGTTDDETIELTVERDTDAITNKIQALVTSYNKLYNWVDEQTGYGETSTGTDDDSSDDSDDDGDLAGDMTAKSIMNTIAATFREQFTSANGKYRNINAIGISTDYSTGEFTVDADKLEKALDTNFNDVLNLFVSGGTSSRSGIVLGKSDSDTKSGTYILEQTGTGYRMHKYGTDEWINSSSVTGDIVSFSDGPVKGLSLTIPAGTMASGDTATFRYSKGFGDLLQEAADALTKNSSSGKGQIALRQDSLNRNIDYAGDRIDTLTTQIEDYRTRLTKQYAAMEQALNTMQTQMSNMLSALGSSDS